MATFTPSDVQLSIRKFVDLANDVLECDHRNFDSRFGAFLAHCENDPVMATITRPLKESTSPEADLEAWLREFESTGGSFVGSKRYRVPLDDELKLSLFYKFFLAIHQEKVDLIGFAIDAFGKTKYDEMVWDFHSHFFEKWVRDITYRLDALSRRVGSMQTVTPETLTVFNVKNLITVTGNRHTVAVDNSSVTIGAEEVHRAESTLLETLAEELRQQGHGKLADRAMQLRVDLPSAKPVHVAQVLDDVVNAVPALRERLAEFLRSVGAGASGSLLAKAIEFLLSS